MVLKRDLLNAIEYYPALKINELDGKLSLSGELDLIHPTEGTLIDTFTVDIFFPDRFPYCFPKVIETSGKIERVQDRHIFPTDNTLCFAVKAEEKIKCKHGITTRWFLDHVLVPRLAEEYIVNHGGKYAHEYSHGPLGDLEFYMEKFANQNPVEVVRLLKLIHKGGFPRHFEKCCCGSDVKFKKCHRSIFEDLKGLGDEFLENEIHKLEELLQKIASLRQKHHEK